MPSAGSSGEHSFKNRPPSERTTVRLPSIRLEDLEPELPSVEPSATTTSGGSEAWQLGEDRGAAEERVLLTGSKELSVPPLKRRKLPPPIPREEPE
jgi:hypothetical protein